MELRGEQRSISYCFLHFSLILLRSGLITSFPLTFASAVRQLPAEVGSIFKSSNDKYPPHDRPEREDQSCGSQIPPVLIHCCSDFKHNPSTWPENPQKHNFCMLTLKVFQPLLSLIFKYFVFWNIICVSSSLLLSALLLLLLLLVVVVFYLFIIVVVLILQTSESDFNKIQVKYKFRKQRK